MYFPALFLGNQFTIQQLFDLDIWDGKYSHWLVQQWTRFSEFVSQPHVLAVILAWAITFTLVSSIIITLGFGPVGVGLGSLAAAFQSCFYGGFTPAGGIFATLTSMAMLGTLMPAAALFAAVFATVISVIVWGCGAGR